MIQKYLQQASQIFPKSTSAVADVEVLLCHLLSVNRAYLRAHSDRVLNEKEQKMFNALMKRRQAGEPIAYIVGHQPFWSLDFLVHDAVLIPRPETELLVESALALSFDDADVLELGTGSGAIIISLAHEKPTWHFTATDLSDCALQVAEQNAKRLLKTNIHFIQSDWFASVPVKKFDIIISNPPYIAEDDSHLSQGDLRYEPRQALASGKDGLDAIRKIVSQAPAYLKPGGCLMLEHGYDQAEAVQAIFAEHGFSNIQGKKDLSKHVRVSIGSIGVNSVVV